MPRNAMADNTVQHKWHKIIIAVVVTVVIAFVGLTLPDHPGAFRPHVFLRFPLEIPLLLLALLLLPRRLGTPFAVLTTLVVFTSLFLRIADIGVQSAFQRRFNPYLDIKMLFDGWNLLSGTIGAWQTALLIALVLTGFIGLAITFFLAQRRIAIAHPRQKRTLAIPFVAILALGTAVWMSGTSLGLGGIADARAASYLEARLSLVAKSVADMHVFEQQLAAEEAEGNAAEKSLFQGIRGRDVVLVFVESYGRSAIEDPRYSSLIRPRLQSVEQQLDAAGFASATTWSRSPTVGGLSWLAHGTFLSGLWVDSQARYDRLMISKRPSLNRLFHWAGWKTTAVMPAISMDWPEADYFGYDQVLAAKDLEYKGKPFNWVTMPDQYTLSAFDKLARRPANRQGQPVMAEIALISSHAPWTPVPTLIDWNDVGDGTAFNDQATSGDTPSVVWSDHDRVRKQYIETIDYSLQTLGDYVARFGDDAVFIILGDHQPASIITGPDASRAVPLHIISRDKKLIAKFTHDGFSPGMTPAADLPEQPMDKMRDLLVKNFSDP